MAIKLRFSISAKALGVVVFFVFFTLLKVYGQNYATKIDSFKKALKNIRNDSLAAELNCNICYLYMHYAPDTGLLYGKQGLVLAQKTDASRQQAQCLNNIGLSYAVQGEYQNAIENFKKCEKIRKKLKDVPGTANVLSNMGLIYYEQGNYSNALKYYYESLKNYEKLPLSIGKGNVLTNIGNIYVVQNEFTKGLDYYKRSQEIYQKIGNKAGEADALTNIGVLYLRLGDRKQALSSFEQSVKINEAISNTRGLAHVLTNIAGIYRETGEYAQALSYYEQSRVIFEKIDALYQLAAVYKDIGQLHFRQSNLPEAFRYLKKATALGKELNSYEILEKSYTVLSQLDSAQGNLASALTHYKLSVVYKDSLFNEEKTKEIGKLEAKHEIEKAQEIAKQKEEAAKKETQRQNNLQYLLIFAGVSVLFLSLFFIGRLKLPVFLSDGLIFLAFLLLFEYILIVTEPFLEEYTGGIPIQKLGLNILLAVIFTPLHKFLEKKFKERVISSIEIPS